MVVLIKTLQVILALSLLILIHELGHFTFAKIFGIRVDKFFLFFDIGGTKLFSTKGRFFTKLCPKAKDWNTEYGIGWLPLGGYCKINGMVDESLDLDSLKGEPKSWEFRSKKPWKRLLVMAGGVLYNFIFAILAYILILSIWGQSYIKNDGNAIYVNELSYEMGFRTGDRIIAFDDYVPENFGMLQADLARRNVRKVKLLRGADTLDLYIDQAMMGKVLNTPGMFSLAVPFVISGLTDNSVNSGADLREGDRIVSVDGVKVDYVQDARPLLSSRAGGSVLAGLVRDGESVEMQLQVDSLGMIGVSTVIPGIEVKDYNFFSAIPAGFALTFSTIGGYLRDLRLVADPGTQAYKSVGSFIAIGQVFPGNWDWYQFIEILALLSIMLGVMNLIPIPGLDGGHIVITLYEMITGRKPGEKFLVISQMIGMALLLLLMFLAFGNDIGRLIK